LIASTEDGEVEKYQKWEGNGDAGFFMPFVQEVKITTR